MSQGPEQGFAVASALIALGGNAPSLWGPPEKTLRAAWGQIEQRIGTVTGKSRIFRTPCFPAGAGPDYANAAVAVSTTFPAVEILRALHAIEADFGRERVQRWGMRTLDLDLLALDDLILPDPAEHARWRTMPVDLQRMRAPDELVLPHPRMQDRAFVLVPLAEVAPLWRHPILGQTVTGMLQALPRPDRDVVVPVGMDAD